MDIESNECVICLEELTNEHDDIRLMCEHTMHSKCLMQLLSTTTHKLHRCPICRKFIAMRSVVHNVYHYDKIMNKLFIVIVLIFVSVMTMFHISENTYYHNTSDST